MTKTAKIVTTIVVLLIIALSIFLGCFFGIKCTVTLEHFYLVPESPDLLIGWAGLGAPKEHTYMNIKVTRNSRYYPYKPSHTLEQYDFGGWYQDYGCTIPWIAGTRVTHDITLYAKWIEQTSK